MTINELSKKLEELKKLGYGKREIAIYSNLQNDCDNSLDFFKGEIDIDDTWIEKVIEENEENRETFKDYKKNLMIMW